ncbi:MAG: thioredoxin domain-containing protein [Sphingopyxis sp.]
MPTSDRGSSKGGQGADEHYQPWLRNQAAGAPVDRPEPLPMRPQSGGGRPKGELPEPARAEPKRPISDLSADELLARPLAIPTSSEEAAPSMGARIGDAATKAKSWAADIIERADVPARVENLELGRRARSATAKGKHLLQAGTAASSAALQSAAQTMTKAAKRASDVSGPKVRAIAEQVSAKTAQGAASASAAIVNSARKAGTHARKFAESSPAAALIPAKGTPPASQLEILMGTEVPPQPAEQGASLPLFVASQPIERANRDAEARDMAMDAETPGRTLPPPINPPPSEQSHSGNNRPMFGSMIDSAWLRHPASRVVGGLALIMSGFAGGMMWNGGVGQRAVTERVVHDYLLNHPEIIPQAMDRLRATRTAEVINRQRTSIERPFSGAWAGAADGDVTLTVFTDYACTFCRASEADIERLLREDRRVKIVFRELPILSQESEAAARLALVAARSGRYMDVHRALFVSGNPDGAARVDVANRFVIASDAAALNNPAITSELRANVALARELGFDGTPSWIVGDKALTGAVGYDALKAAIAEARR